MKNKLEQMIKNYQDGMKGVLRRSTMTSIKAYLEQQGLIHGLCHHCNIVNIDRYSFYPLIHKYRGKHQDYIGNKSVKQCTTKAAILEAMELRIQVLSEILVNKEYQKFPFIIW